MESKGWGADWDSGCYGGTPDTLTEFKKWQTEKNNNLEKNILHKDRYIIKLIKDIFNLFTNK